MLKHKVTGLATLACVLSLRYAYAQINPPADGLYRILSGTYSECCGFVGTDTVYTLPDSEQAFMRLIVDSQNRIATMVVLGEDRQTQFSRVPCSAGGAINFYFPYGFSLGDSFLFQVDPGPPPYQMSYYYTASNSANLLRIDGTLGISAAGCSDTPTRFGHSNVLAVLVPPPRLSLLEFSKNRASRLMIQGNAGQTNVLEASVDLKAWTPVSTNVMDYSLCPICPFAVFEDSESTNLAGRFYRVFER
jgi:hypothetical protein